MGRVTYTGGQDLPKGNIFAVTNFVMFDTTTPLPESFELDKPYVFNGVVMCTCLRGSARFRLNYRELEIVQGQILTIMPDQIIRELEHSGDFFCEILFFPVDFIADYPSPTDYDFLFRIEEQPCITVPEETRHSLLELHALIVKHYHMTDRPYNKEIVKSLLFSLLLMVVSVYETNYGGKFTQAKSRQEEITEQFFKLLFEHHKKERSVAFYADLLCITPKYLTTVVKKVTGHSILDWINEIVVIGLKTSLRTTSLTVLQISEDFNFANPSFFSRYFKQYTGMTPMQYRQEGLEKEK